MVAVAVTVDGLPSTTRNVACVSDMLFSFVDVDVVRKFAYLKRFASLGDSTNEMLNDVMRVLS